MTDYVFQQSLGLPGINRDQTPFQTKNYVDGLRTRFYNNEPRKMGGEFLCNGGKTEICRGMFGSITADQIVADSGINCIYLYSGTIASISYFLLNNDGESLGTIDVTPSSLTIDSNNLWSFDNYSDRPAPNVLNEYVLAMVRPASNNISTNNPGSVYFGLSGDPTSFVELGANITLNGFILSDPPFIFIGGQSGILIWNDYNGNPFNFPADNNHFLFVNNTKLVAAKLIRGGSGTSFLVWSLTGLDRITFNGAPSGPPFDREPLSRNISIISQNCVVEVPSISTYFWIGKNCFYQYNGVVSELINTFNKKWFFNNINKNAQEKCWTEVRADYNEVWFHFPFGTATECTNAAIYNWLLKCWYDDVSLKSAGIDAQFLSYSVQADSTILNNIIGNGAPTFGFWLEEFGTDLRAQGQSLAIKSYIRSHDRLLASIAPNQDIQSRTRRLEPDIILDGQMKLNVYIKEFPGSNYEISRDYFLRDPITGNIGKVDIVNMGRIVSYYFESNEVGGFYQFGRNIIDIAPDRSERPSS